MLLSERLIRVGFDKDVALVLEELFERCDEAPGLAASDVGVTEEFMLGLVEEKLVRPVNVRVEGRKHVVIYRINDLFEILDKKLAQWKEYYTSIRIEIDNCRKSVDSAKVNRCRKSNHRIGYKEKPVEDKEFKAYKRVKRNLYEHREFIEQWKNDILNGVVRKGRPPAEVVRWRKLSGIKTKTEIYNEHINDVAKERLVKSRAKREVSEDVDLPPVKPPGKAVFKKRR